MNKETKERIVRLSLMIEPMILLKWNLERIQKRVLAISGCNKKDVPSLLQLTEQIIKDYKG